MELLITLLIYLIFFAVLYYAVIYILGLLAAPPIVLNIAKAILAVLLLIFVWGLIAGTTYLPRIHVK